MKSGQKDEFGGGSLNLRATIFILAGGAHRTLRLYQFFVVVSGLSPCSGFVLSLP